MTRFVLPSEHATSASVEQRLDNPCSSALACGKPCEKRTRTRPTRAAPPGHREAENEPPSDYQLDRFLRLKFGATSPIRIPPNRTPAPIRNQLCLASLASSVFSIASRLMRSS